MREGCDYCKLVRAVTKMHQKTRGSLFARSFLDVAQCFCSITYVFSIERCLCLPCIQGVLNKAGRRLESELKALKKFVPGRHLTEEMS